MRPGLLLAIVLAVGALAACDDRGDPATDPPGGFTTRHPDYVSNETRARGLRRELARMPGVTKVGFEYEAGYRGFGDGSAGFSIEMHPSASDAEIEAVYRAAFRGMASGLPGDSADAGIDRGRDQVSLHLDDTRARPEDADAVLRFALSNRRPGETLELYVSSQDDDDPRIVESQVTFKLPVESDREDILPRLDRFDPGDVPPHADVRVLAADLSALSGFDGFPTREDRQIWSALNGGPHASSYTVDFGPLNIADGSSRNAMVTLDLKREAQDPTRRRQFRSEFITAHVETLNKHLARYRYFVNRGYGGILQLMGTLCDDETPFSGWRREVALVYTAHVCAD